MVVKNTRTAILFGEVAPISANFYLRENVSTVKKVGASLVEQWLLIYLPMIGDVSSVSVGELGSHMPQGNY